MSKYVHLDNTEYAYEIGVGNVSIRNMATGKRVHHDINQFRSFCGVGTEAIKPNHVWYFLLKKAGGDVSLPWNTGDLLQFEPMHYPRQKLSYLVIGKQGNQWALFSLNLKQVIYWHEQYAFSNMREHTTVIPGR